MKNNFEKLIKKAALQEGLSAAEREKMRYVLTEYIAFKPITATAEPVSRYQRLLHAMPLYLRRPLSVSLAGVIVVVLASGGIAYAAEGTLPGDILYPVKVSVVEPIQTALAFSPTAQAQVHIALAERRVDEASTLANEGKLSSTTEVALAANFSANSTAATQAIQAQAAADPLGAAVSATTFSAELGGYETVLSQIDSRRHSNTKLLQDSIHTQIASSNQVTASDESLATATSSARTAFSATPAYLASLQQRTTDALHTSSDLLNSASSTLQASGSADARGQFDSAAQSAAQGSSLFTHHDNQGAFNAFQSSLSDTSRLDVLTRTAATLDLNTFASTSATSTSQATTTPPMKRGHQPSNHTPTPSLPLGL